MRIHFLNENVDGHATMHAHLRTALAEHPDVETTFFDVPPPRLLRRLVAGPVPGLGRLDLDLHPLRDQLSKSWVVRRNLESLRIAPDVLHLYTHNAGLLSVGAMQTTPAVVSLDATNRQNAFRLPQRYPTRFTPLTIPISAFFERRVYGSARRVVTHSTWAADSVQSYGVAPASIDVIPFGIRIPPNSPHAEDETGPPTIVFIGRSMERKGGYRLLRIWRRWLADRSRLVLVTGARVAPEPGVEVRNDIRPGDGQIDPLLRTASVFAMPGEIDAFGYALLEAMAAELPIVAPAQGAVPEIVADGVTGTLVPPGDDHAFARALRVLVDDGAMRRQMGEAGRRRLEERFDATRTTADLVEVLRAVSAR